MDVLNFIKNRETHGVQQASSRHMGSLFLSYVEGRLCESNFCGKKIQRLFIDDYCFLWKLLKGISRFASEQTIAQIIEISLDRYMENDCIDVEQPQFFQDLYNYFQLHNCDNEDVRFTEDKDQFVKFLDKNIFLTVLNQIYHKERSVLLDSIPYTYIVEKVGLNTPFLLYDGTN